MPILVHYGNKQKMDEKLLVLLLKQLNLSKNNTICYILGFYTYDYKETNVYINLNIMSLYSLERKVPANLLNFFMLLLVRHEFLIEK
jgi:hypothetical protein